MNIIDFVIMIPVLGLRRMLFLVDSSWELILVIICHGSTRNALYWRLIKPLGIRPCPLYTPPVALTDDFDCE